MKEPDNLPRLKNWIEEGVRAVRVTGLSGSAQSYYFAQFLADIKAPSLVILPDRKEAERLNKELQFFMSTPDIQDAAGSVQLLDFPPYDVTPLTGLSPHREVSTRRGRYLP
jgi:transcription-repair coupling factor (superfamily II helicase)